MQDREDAMAFVTITLRVDQSEYDEIAARAERDKVSLSDYVRVRLGLRGEGPQEDGASGASSGTENDEMRAQLADHDRRLVALETDRAAVTAA